MSYGVEKSGLVFRTAVMPQRIIDTKSLISYLSLEEGNL